MSTQAGNIGIALLAVGLGALGLLLLVFGLWPRRCGNTPYCRKCGYRLSGLASERCPECGRLLADAGVVHGEVRRKPLLAVFSIFLLIVSGLTTVGIIRQFDLYPYLPTFWIMRDLASSRRPEVNKAWAELMRRDDAKKLSANAASRLIDVCLERKADPVNRRELDWLGSCDLKGRLTPLQTERLYSDAVKIELNLRECVRAGDRIPFRMTTIVHGPKGYTYRFSIREMWVGGVRQPSYETENPPWPLDGAPGTVAGAFPAHPAGKHDVTLLVEVILSNPKRELRHTRRERIETAFEARSPEEPDPLQPVHNPELAAELQRRISITDLEITGSGALRGMCTFGVGRFPCTLAFEILARVDGTEYTVAGSAKRRTADTWGLGSSFGSLSPIPPRSSIDIILRGSERVARGTVDLYEFWDGELVYHDVPVRMPATAPAADN